ncbi:hypothetical protein B0H63DRAFT_43342 [Podospora didyma]|uniref:Acetylserotonin methytransferase-like protein n=1 Tax=Podospora didyma TaxID=330526 RepID=A0AAE0U7Y8_9PEZI|nr:hypothetical protein B0H63DRAFT_43342 [Podospora didyma]
MSAPSAPPPPSGGGFSLFPNTSVVQRPPSRNQALRPARDITPQGRPSSRNQSSRPGRDPTPQGRPSISAEASTPSRVARQGSLRREPSVKDGRQKRSNNPWQAALDAQEQQERQQIEDLELQRQQEEQRRLQRQQWREKQRELQQQQQQQRQLEEQQQRQQQQQEEEERQQRQHQQQEFSPLNQNPQINTAAPPTIDPIIETRTRSPIAAGDVPPRCETAFSDARTLVRSPSPGPSPVAQRQVAAAAAAVRSSIAKPPLTYTPASSSGDGSPDEETHHHHRQQPPPIRSIFPQYNPEVPLDRQDYYPTQASPTHIPQAAISRALYSPRSEEARSPQQQQHQVRSPAMASSPAAAPTAGSTTTSRWPNQGQGAVPEPPHVIPPVSTTEELRSLWKVANGWKASPLEGRLFCLKMTAERDAPIYTLTSSSGQPFYNMRVDPTSASALVSLSRYDPNKPFKGLLVSSSAASGSSGTSSPVMARATSSSSKAAGSHDAKHWHEVLGTTLEEASRKQPPNDGLVAQLWPAAAARLALDRANDATTVALAEHECARLVWDADSGYHYLVHPALAMPFCVTVERNAAFSRTEYTLEHLESPQHLGKLTRDGTGAGWLEVDTSIAAKVDAVYIVDVVVAALVLVAHADDLFTHVEAFEPPPVFDGPEGAFGSDRRSSRGSGRTSRISRASQRVSRRESRRIEKERKKEMATTRKPAKSRLEQFEMDLESQTSEFAKGDKSKEKEKVPSLARGIIALITVIFKCFVWCITLLFKALTAMVKCVSSDKL